MSADGSPSNSRHAPIRIGVIPAAGRGVRAYPQTSYMPKAMVSVGGQPVLQWNIELMRDQVGIREIYLIVGYLREQIQQHFSDGSRLGVRIRYVIQEQPAGIGAAIALLKDVIQEPFLVILGDELYADSNHRDLTTQIPRDYDGICGFLEVADRPRITKNYSVELTDGRIASLVEKPKAPSNNLLGCGTYVFTPKVFQYIERTPPSALRHEVEITDVISAMAQEGKVYPFMLTGEYLNITSVEDMHHANYFLRNRRFKSYRVSVVIPAYNEEASIGRVVEEFRRPPVHEVLVVDNGSQDRTIAEATARGARVLHERRKGYGHALKRGLDEAVGDIILLTEADGTFKAKDVPKVLEYLKDADLVVGTRTTTQLIEQGANMNALLRWGNVAVGKLIQLLWWRQGTRFTDVGCTFRGIWREAYAKLRERLCASGPEFSPEMMVEALRARLRIIEIPVSYSKRVSGESKHSGGWKKVRTALRMIRLILRKRFQVS